MIAEIYVFITGLFIGSFLNVLADRLSREITLLGRSKCENCNHKLSWKDLIPLISYCKLNGKCNYCKAPISIQYPLSELFTGALFLLTYTLSKSQNATVVEYFLNFSFISMAIVILLADLRYKIIPDEVQISFIVIALIKFFYPYYNLSFSIQEVLSQASKHFLESLIVGLPLLLVFFVTKQRGIGFGDVKFGFGIGLFLGLWSGLLALYIAFVTGGVFGIYLLLTKNGKPKTAIPFGPFLVFGTFCMIFFEHYVYKVIMLLYGF